MPVLASVIIIVISYVVMWWSRGCFVSATPRNNGTELKLLFPYFADELTETEGGYITELTHLIIIVLTCKYAGPYSHLYVDC